MMTPIQITIISSSNQHLQISSHQLPQNKCQSKINLSIFLVDMYIYIFFFWWNFLQPRYWIKPLKRFRFARHGVKAWKPIWKSNIQAGATRPRLASMHWKHQGHGDDPQQIAGKCCKKQLDMMKWRNMVRMSLWKLKWLNESIDLIKHKFTVSVWWFLPRKSSQSACCMPGLKQPARIAPESCA